MAPFDRLPIEVVTEVVNVLDYHSLPNFRLTSKLFASFVSPKRLTLAFLITKLRLLYTEWQHSLQEGMSWNPMIRRYNHQITALLRPQFNDRDCRSVANRALQLLQLRVNAELCPLDEIPDLLPCYFCLKYVPRENFVPSQIKRKRVFGRLNCIYRFCNDCAVRKKNGRRARLSIMGRGISGSASVVANSKHCESSQEVAQSLTESARIATA